jgi:hypothetical protein
VRWYPSLLRVRTATNGPDEEEEAPEPGTDAGDPAAPAGGEGKDGDAAADGSAEKRADLGSIRGLDLPRGLDKPLLVYFHWPHEDGERGRRVVKYCSGPLDDEAFVRVTPLFHCVEVNVRDSEERLVAESGLRGTPSMAVCRPDGTILWKTEEAAGNGRALAETLKKVLRTRFAPGWERIEKEAKEQKVHLADARRHLAARKTEEALASLNLVVNSDVRFTDEWAQAVKLLREEEKKAEEAAKRK